jgi:trehalose-phosphatase
VQTTDLEEAQLRFPELQAVVFDTDGVITQTAAVHFSAWKDVFDRYLEAHVDGDAARPFTDADYRTYVDGVGRYDGVDRFLRSRGIEIPFGMPDDPPGDATVCAIGNMKNDAFEAAIERHGVRPYLTTRRFVEALRAEGIRTAVISASKNCDRVLAAAGMDDLFEVRVDGNDAAAIGFPGKPAPDVFLEATSRLGVDPSRAAVVEDAISGVQAGRAGGFAMVIGLDRTRNPGPLAEFADLVVPDCADLEVVGRTVRQAVPARAHLRDLPDALEDHDLTRLLDRRSVAIFLDYDGTLTPIVDRPELAVMDDGTRRVLHALAEVAVVGIVSGRDLDDVEAMVSCPGLWLSGSHGFDIRRPDGSRVELDVGSDSLLALDAAEGELSDGIGEGGGVGEVEGAWVERKRFAIAVHYRASPPEGVPRLQACVEAVAALHPDLRMTGGKKIFELRPAVDWDKGAAVSWLLEASQLDPEHTLAVFLGDDVTDEDAFASIRFHGVGVVVGDDDRITAATDRLDDPTSVRVLLEELASRLGAT